MCDLFDLMHEVWISNNCIDCDRVTINNKHRKVTFFCRFNANSYWIFNWEQSIRRESTFNVNRNKYLTILLPWKDNKEAIWPDMIQVGGVSVSGITIFSRSKYTVIVTGETLVLNKIFPGFMLGKSLLYAGTNHILPTFPV